MSKKTIEIRSIAEVPVAAVDSRTISGYAIVWGVESRLLWGFDGEFVEVIDRSAVDEELIGKCDIKALFNHRQDYLLARSVNGVGTLRLSIDDRGLKFEFEAPETSAGNDVLELVKRGDLQGCSFAFTCDNEDVTYDRRADGKPLRTVHKIRALYDVSVVVDPAYMQTSVDVRSAMQPLTQEPPKPVEPSPELLEFRRRLEKLDNSINPLIF